MKCKSKNKKGKDCSALVVKGKEFCRVHDPETKTRVGQPKKTGYYSTALQDPEELSAYIEALEMSHAEALTEIRSSQMAKSRILHNAALDERTKLDLINRAQDSARRAAKDAADVEAHSKFSEGLKSISWLWGDEEDNGESEGSSNSEHATETSD